MCSFCRPTPLEQPDGPLVALLGVHAVECERRGDDLADPLARIEGRERVLEHHLHVLAQRLERRATRLRDVLAAEDDLAVRRIGEPHERRARAWSSRTRLPRRGRAVSPSAEVEGDVVDRVHPGDGPVDDHAGLDRKCCLRWTACRRGVRPRSPPSPSASGGGHGRRTCAPLPWLRGPNWPSEICRPCTLSCTESQQRSSWSGDRGDREPRVRHLRCTPRTRAGSGAGSGQPSGRRLADAACRGSTAGARSARGRCGVIEPSSPPRVGCCGS
jgi:hypothetical protein